MAQHALGDVEVRDDAVLHGPDGHDAPGRAAYHPLRLLADGQHLIRFFVDGDDRRFLHDHAFALDVDQRVGGTKVDAHVAPEGAEHSVLCPLSRAAETIR